uniref:Ribosomal protein L37 n=1 Tax=Solanum tuberosum TaxID=4113 RepID=M0ZRH5_SOLTU
MDFRQLECEGNPQKDNWYRPHEVPPQRPSQIQDQFQRRYTSYYGLLLFVIFSF